MTQILATSLGLASVLLLVALSLDAPDSLIAYRVANYLLVAAVAASLGVSLMWRPRFESSIVSLPLRRMAGGTAIVTSVGIGVAHYGAGASYAIGVSLLVGASVATMSADFGPPADPRHRGAWSWLFFLIVAALGVIGREVAPGSFVQTWIVSPIFVLVMPGLALAHGFLPSRTSNMERLLWAPVLSIAVQLVGLVWLDWLGFEATLPVFYLLAIGSTVAGLVAVQWDQEIGYRGSRNAST